MLCFVGCFLLVSFVEAQPEGVQQDSWLKNLEQAKKLAEQRNASMLINFTGSTWCAPCVRIKKALLYKKAFIQEASKEFVLVEVELPMPKEKGEDLWALSKAYGIEKYPTFIIADPRGLPYDTASLYYDSDWSVPVSMAKLSGHRKKLDARNAYFAAAATSTGKERVSNYKKALAIVPQKTVPTLYRSVVEEMSNLDVESQRVFQRKADVEKKLETLQDKVLAMNLESEMQDAVAAVDQFIAEAKPQGEQLQRALFLKAMAYGVGGKVEMVDPIRKQIFAIDPTTETADRIRPKAMPTNK